ncbi:MAG: hypothetical protein IJR69_11865 [Bacteroidaceae bacterium]|nr:hypothetical protein [Bacteroidaceae bacterium]
MMLFLDASQLPTSAVNNHGKFMETKKAWELLLLPIPDFRLSHCLYVRISNADSPRPVIIL